MVALASLHLERPAEEETPATGAESSRSAATRADLEAENARLRAENEELRAQVEDLKARIAAMERRIFQRRSEKMKTPAQELKREQPADPEATRRKRAANAEQKKSLPTEDLPIPVPPDQKTCPKCGGAVDRSLPPEESCVYEYIPGRFIRLRHQREKLGCSCGEHIVTAPAPPKVVEKGQYGPGLCAHAAVSKCMDALPIYRLAKRFEREGVPISVNTLLDIFHRTAELCAPLAKEILAHIARSEVVLADETPMPVIAKGKTHRSYIWTFLDDDYIGYRYSHTRSGETPRQVLGGTTGTFVADAYSGYNCIAVPDGRLRAGCLAHFRRKLFECLGDHPEVEAALTLIREVYRVEHEVRERGIVRSPEHRGLRLGRSTVAMDSLRTWLEAAKPGQLPKSPLGKAIAYGLGNWTELTRFLKDPTLPPDNNASERALRIVALGRKNYLFVGNDLAGQHLADLMTVVHAAAAVGLNPQVYLADVLLRLATTPQSRVDELLPLAWKARHAPAEPRAGPDEGEG